MNDEAPEDRLQRERTGVSGDPVPDHEYGDSPEDLTPDVAPDEAGDGVSPSVRGAARRLADPGLLTDRQALAYVLRDVEGVSRPDSAERMGVSVSTLDSLLGTARRKLGQARDTLDLADDLADE
ncbi:hypothetical protein K745_gp47 [Haloarcula hispanica virus PH1]|uniref:RNA polymerase sigma factor 70 region 4 type 2 domain-containing protein n=1 Tax=Haloarcula hispanica virus PH1 TaxID=1282967 RepID=M4JG86_9VIRU|nr:hypothetical protein K745_gp47 [Haloarcula hispanica virus PH1]AGC65572.1 hypothetical protein HhPH1_gp47 [Haloarcula hispanica virus PH1]